jgi:dipeptidyl aminopeptidase/acylaminoacyl peptidase
MSDAPRVVELVLAHALALDGGAAHGGAATALPTIAELMGRTYVRDVAISPDGSRVLAFLVDGRRSTELELLELPVGTEGEPRAGVSAANSAGAGDEPTRSPSPRLPNDALVPVEWSRDGTAAFVVRAPPIAEVWVMRPGEPACPALFPDQCGEVFDLFWRHDGARDQLLVLRNEPGVGVREAVLRSADPTTREVGDPVLRLGGLTVREATLSCDGRWLAATGTFHPTRAVTGEPLDLFVVEVATGVARRLTDGRSSVDRPAFAPDGRALAVARRDSPTLLGAAKRDLLWIELKSGLTRNLTRERSFSLGDGVNGFAELIHFLPDGRLATATQDGLADHVICVSPEAGIRGVPPAGFATDQLRSWQRLRVAPCGAFVAVESSPTEPERIVVGDVRDWHSRTLHAPNEGLAERLGADVEVVSWRGADGLSLEGLLLTPASEPSPWPTVVVLHGGSAGRHTARFNDGYAHAFAGAGCAVFLPNLRGSAGYDLDFERANEGDFGGAELDDLSRAVDQLIARGSADPERLFLYGHSYGGFLVELMLARTGRFAAAVAAAAVSDWESYAEQSDLPQLAELGLGSRGQHVERWRERSPLSHAARITTPLLLLHGQRDQRVPHVQSVSLQKAITAAGGVCELRSEPTEGHLYRDRGAIAASVEGAIEWFRENSAPLPGQ